MLRVTGIFLRGWRWQQVTKVKIIVLGFVTTFLVLCASARTGTAAVHTSSIQSVQL